ncbi:MAG: AsmA family protein [Burkholderiaceae bacterium]
MKVWFKRISFGVVVAVIVALVGLAIFLLTFDPNAYKSKLEEIVYNRYHRTLAIEGDIQLSLFPRIGLSVQGVSLSDRDSRSTFASVDSARFAVAIWPLLSNRLVVDHVAVAGFKAWVIRDKLGEFNFHDLTESRSPWLDLPVVGDSGLGSIHAPKVADSSSKPATLPAVLKNHEASRADFQIDIAGLDLKNGEIHLYDAVTGSVARIEKLIVNTGRMTFDQPFDVTVKGRLFGEHPVADANIEGQALVKMSPEQKNYSAQKLNVQVTGRLGPLQAKTVSLKGNLAYSAYSRMFGASNLELLVQGGVDGVEPIKNLDANLSVRQLKADQSRAELNLDKLSLRAKGDLPNQNFDVAFDAPSIAVSPDAAKSDVVSGTVKLTGLSVLGVTLGLRGLDGNAQSLTLKELKVEGNLKQGDRLIQLNASSPANWDTVEDKGALTAIKGDVKIEAPAMRKGSFEFPLIGSMHADLKKDQLTSEINAVLNGSKLDFTVAATHLRDPNVVFNLDADSLDFNRLFPPTEVKAPAPADAKKPTDKAPAEAPKASADAAKTPADTAKATAGAAKAPVVTAKAAASKVAAANAPAAKPIADQPIDLSALNSMNLTGEIKVGAVKMRHFEAKDFNASVRAFNGKLDVSKVSANLYGGKLAGNLRADAHNAMALKFALDGVSVADLLKGMQYDDRLAGVGNVHADLSAQGANQTALKAALKGSVQVRVRDGSIKGIGIEQTMKEVAVAARSVLTGQLPDVANKFDLGRQTAFSLLDADVVFDQGKGTLKKLSIVAPMLRISEGSPGLIDLVGEKLDVLVKVQIVNPVAGQADKDLAALKGVTVPVLISGPFSAPGYQVQWKDVGGHLVKQAVQDGLLDLLSGKAAKFVDPVPAIIAPQPGPTTSTGSVKSIGNALKGLLGK